MEHPPLHTTSLDDYIQLGAHAISGYLTIFDNVPCYRPDETEPIVLSTPTTTDGQHLIVAESFNDHRRPDNSVNHVGLVVERSVNLDGTKVIAVHREDEAPIQIYNPSAMNNVLLDTASSIGRLLLVRGISRRTATWTPSVLRTELTAFGPSQVADAKRFKNFLQLVGDYGKLKLVHNQKLARRR